MQGLLREETLERMLQAEVAERMLEEKVPRDAGEKALERGMVNSRKRQMDA